MAIGALGYSSYAAYAGYGDSYGAGYNSASGFGTSALDGVGGSSGAGKVGAAEETDATGKGQALETKGECETCKNRKYKDGSDENVSFKAATHISPNAAASAVRGHEGEHVSNAYTEAAEKGGRVISASVSIHTATCPECGRTYVSGGLTSTAIAYPKDDGAKSSQRDTTKNENFDV